MCVSKPGASSTIDFGVKTLSMFKFEDARIREGMFLLTGLMVGAPAGVLQIWRSRR